MIVNPYKLNTGIDSRELCGKAHKHNGCGSRPFSGWASDVPLRLCPRCPQESVQNQHGKTPKPPHSPLTPPLSLHPNTQRGPTKRISQTSVGIVARSYAEWQGFGYFVGCEGPLENFCWVSMVMGVKEHSTFLQRSVWVLVRVCGWEGVLSKEKEKQVLVSCSTLFLAFSFVVVVLLLLH